MPQIHGTWVLENRNFSLKENVKCPGLSAHCTGFTETRTRTRNSETSSRYSQMNLIIAVNSNLFRIIAQVQNDLILFLEI